jgi:hypothetical protein
MYFLCCFLKKTVFEELGTLTQNKSGQDTDMWIRIGLIYPVLFSWKILARYVYDEKVYQRIKLLDTKVDFSKFKEDEKSNPVENFLDLNRFSLAIKHKIAEKKHSTRLLRRH